jgi:flagellar FliL protein
MKKSLLTVLTFALVLINLVLTGLMAFQIIPEVKNVNALISKVSSAMDLDMKVANAANGNSTVPLENLATYALADSLNINLKDTGDGQQHFASMSVTLYMDSTSDAYSKYSAELSSDSTTKKYDSMIKNKIIEVVQQYTVDQVQNDSDQIKNDIKDSLNEYFGAQNFIVDVAFSSVTVQ